MPQQGGQSASKSTKRKISHRRLKDLRKRSSVLERRLSSLSKRADEVNSLIGSSNGEGRTSFVMEIEYIDSQREKLSAVKARLAKTHSEYLAKNKRIEEERLGLS